MAALASMLTATVRAESRSAESMCADKSYSWQKVLKATRDWEEVGESVALGGGRVGSAEFELEMARDDGVCRLEPDKWSGGASRYFWY